MSVTPLTSNHVNYLIWRYLQESGHGDAAVKLQRDWNQDPQSLPFAPHIKTHALVRLVQKGLQYYEIERSLHQDGDHFLSKAFFTSDARRATSSPRRDVSQDESIGHPPGSPRARKHGREPSTANGMHAPPPSSAPATKKARRSNSGIMAAIESATTNGDSMDLDRNGFAQHEPPEPISPDSPAEEGQMAADGGGMDVIDDAPEPDDSRMTLTDGPSVGVQSDKPTELGPETSVLVVPHRNVLHAAWNPTDPQLLAVAGDALCRIWSFTKSPDAPHERPNPGYQAIDIMELDHDSSVTAMSWSPDGKVLAVATKYEDGERNGEVSLWDKDGRSIDNLPAAQDYLLALSWSPTGTYLLGLTSSGSAASMVQVWQLLTSYTFPAIPLDHVAIGATWTDEHRFLVCGHSLVARFLVESENELTHKVHDDPDLMRTWTYTRYDPITKMVAIAAEDSGHLALVAIHDQDWDHSCIKAHNAGITAMTFQPETRSTPYSPTFPRRLATSSLDGDVRIWDVTNPFVELQRLNFGRTNPPMAISFDPDGHLIAAANTNRALIWNVETGGVPKARWRGEPTSTHSGLGYVSKREDSNGGMIMDGDSGIGEEEDRCTHSLDWSSDGAKLAYATGTQQVICSAEEEHLCGVGLVHLQLYIWCILRKRSSKVRSYLSDM
ncbi:MAG: hypothetical protein LQ352_005504 [Teloschistes flavicans]|nr:MAG: hypothetical protein LQ352_005504 [Teloschistes flavicans]